MNSIFISYRRADAKHVAGRLVLELEKQFPGVKVFIDIDCINPGEDLDERLRERLSDCSHLIAIVGGRKWLGSGKPSRIYSEEDWVRREIVTAIERGIPIIPLLIDDAKMPKPQDLPPELKSFPNKRAWQIAHETFAADVKAVISKLGLHQVEAAIRPLMDEDDWLAGLDDRDRKLLPTSPTPVGLADLSDEETIQQIVEWFFENFEDPVHASSFNSEEGGYLWNHGGPFDTRDQVECAFGDQVSQNVLEGAIDEIESDGISDWAPSARRC